MYLASLPSVRLFQCVVVRQFSSKVGLKPLSFKDGEFVRSRQGVYYRRTIWVS